MVPTGRRGRGRYRGRRRGRASPRCPSRAVGLHIRATGASRRLFSCENVHMRRQHVSNAVYSTWGYAGKPVVLHNCKQFCTLKLAVLRRDNGHCAPGRVRGGPENTVEAFVEAAPLGADMVELDVRRTADGGAGRVPRRRARRRPAHRRAAQRSTCPPPCPPSTEALDACAGMAVNIEIKNSAASTPTSTRATRSRPRWPRLIGPAGARRRHRLVASTWPRSTPCGPPTGASATGLAHRAGARPACARSASAAERGHVALHPHHTSVTAELIDAAHAAGLRVNTWTVDDPDRMRRAGRAAASTASSPTSPRPGRALGSAAERARRSRSAQGMKSLRLSGS